MLIKVTTVCSMGCPHCMEDARPEGVHMTRETFEEALAFAERVEGPCRGFGYNLLMLSGGEPTEHPDILDLITLSRERGFLPTLLTNGMRFTDETFLDDILKAGALVQVTNDPRFYPEAPPVVERPGVAYVDSLTVMVPLGRFAGKEHGEVPTRKGPACFNLRSIMRSGRVDDADGAIRFLRIRAATGAFGSCIPSVCTDGTVVAGESRFCHSIGTVRSTPEELAQALRTMTCSQCRLADGLPLEHRRAIGESVLYGPDGR